MEAAAVGDEIVGDGDVLSSFGFVVVLFGLAKFDATRAEISEGAVLDEEVSAAAGEFQTIFADMGNGAILDHSVPPAFGMDSSAEVDLGLGIETTLGGECPVGVFEGEALELDLGDVAMVGEVAFDIEKVVDFRGDDDGAFGGFSGHGDVREFTGVAIEVPLPGLAEGFADVFDDVAISFGEVCPSGIVAGGASGGDDVSGVVDIAYSHAAHVPGVEAEEFDVVEVVPVFIEIAGFESETIEAVAFCLSTGGRFARDIVVAVLRESRAVTALSIDEKLAEVPLPRLDFGEGDGPPAVAVHVETVNLTSTTEDGVVAMVDGWRSGGSGVFGVKLE